MRVRSERGRTSWASAIDKTSAAHVLTAAAFIALGVNHFLNAPFYVRLIPEELPAPHVLVLLSGVAEIAGGIGLLMPSLRRWAGWCLIALMLAVFPANLYMALQPHRFADLGLPAWSYWARLPLQAVIIAWIWRIALRRPPRGEH